MTSREYKRDIARSNLLMIVQEPMELLLKSDPATVVQGSAAREFVGVARLSVISAAVYGWFHALLQWFSSWRFHSESAFNRAKGLW